MLLKKQFLFARIILISFPLFCIAMICALKHIRIPMDDMKTNLDKAKSQNPTMLPEHEWQLLFRAITSVPAEADAAVVYRDVVISSTQDFLEPGSVFTDETLEKIHAETPEHCFLEKSYPLSAENTNLFIISRLDLKTARFTREIFPSLFLVMIIILAIFNTILYRFSRKIFTFILNINNKTKEIYAEENSSSLMKNDDLEDVSSTLEYLESLKNTLKETKNSRARFIMGVSHDLRTPIAVIKGYTEAMHDGMLEDTEERNNALDIISVKISQLESMINTLINYERLESKGWHEKLNPTLIKRFLTAFAKNAAATGTIFKKNVTYSIEISDTLKINMNEQLAQRAFENIFSNALRYTENDGNIHISATETIDDVLLQISDSGCGIEEKDLKNIFEIFYRASNSRREEGMGIGLAVVKNIMEIHEWEIKVTSKLNVGTSFIIKMPKKPKTNFITPGKI